MDRFAALVAVVVLGSAAGCKSTFVSSEVPGEPKPALLVGPDATGKAAPPVELPARESAQVCLVTAQNYELEGRVEDAIRLFEKARATDPGLTAVATRRLASLYDKAGDFSKSAAMYEAALRASPRDADLLNDLGYSHYSRGDWASAAAVLARALETDPNHKKAWINLGMAQAQLGQLDASFTSFCNAVRAADAHCNVGFILAAQGNKEGAKAQYKQALVLDPGLKAAQIGLTQLELPATNPPPAGGTPRGKRDAAEAAAQVPTVAEIEARLKNQSSAGAIDLPESVEKPAP